MKLRSKAIQGAKWSTLQQVAGQLIEFSVFIVIARILGPAEFGLVALAAVVISLINPLVAQGLGAAIVQRDKLEPEHLDSVFWVNVGIGVLLAILLSSSSSLFANVFSQPLLSPVLICLSFSFILTSLTTVQEAVVRKELRFKALAIRVLSAKIIAGVIGITMALNDYGVWSLVARQLVNSIASVILLWRVSDWRPHKRFSKKHYLELFPFGIKVLANEILIFINRRSANLLIGYFLGTIALGFYNIAYRFMYLLLQLVSKAVHQVGMPTFAKIQHKPERLKKGLYEVTQIIALVSIPAFIGVVVLAPDIVSLLLGKKWLPAIPVFQILMLIGIVQTLLSPMVTILVGVGKPGIRLKLQVIDAIANLSLFFIVVHWGITAVAIAYTTIGYLMVPLWFRAVKKVVPIHFADYIKCLKGPFISSSTMVVWLITTQPTFIELFGNSAALFVSIITGALVYTMVIYFFFRDSITKVLLVLHELLLPS